MGKIYCLNTDKGLIPLYPSDYDEKKKLKLNQVYALDPKKERNYLFLKKFMAMVKIGCEYSKNVDMPFDVYRDYITIKSGYADVFTTPDGVFVKAQSIAFASMDEDKFQDVYNRVLDKILADTEFNKEEIEKNLLSFM